MSAEILPTIAAFVDIDRRIDESREAAFRARWEFGHMLLAARDGAGRLPNGFLAELVDETGKSRRELSYRAQFATDFPSEAELCNALHSFGSWRDAIRALEEVRPPRWRGKVDVPEGKFTTFVADPPWRYGNTSTRGAAEDHYETMSIEELCGLTIVPDAAADESHLYLWTTAGHLPEAFAVMSAWGFEYKTYLVWVKPQMGMGNYFRVSTELVLFGTRGGMRTMHRGLKNYFEAKRSRHSAKPTMFQDLVMQASPGPYMELFSRCRANEMLTGCTCSKCRLGWTVWGDQS